MKKVIKDLSISVHVRLSNIAKSRGRPFQEIFYYYAIECFLRRLSMSAFAQDFVLKGGLAFQGWGLPLRRPTRDIDVQGYTHNSIENLVQIVKDVCSQEIEADGMLYDSGSVYGEQIMEDTDYLGTRVHFHVHLGTVETWLHIDFSFGNAITPKEMQIQYPTLLDASKFSMREYPPETSIAEKCEAMIKLGIVNGRMKDFYDIWFLTQQMNISGITLTQAFTATFTTRKTSLPQELPEAFSEQFVQIKQTEWNGFIRRSQLLTENIPDFSEIIEIMRQFLWPPLQSATGGHKFRQIWPARGPWKEQSE